MATEQFEAVNDGAQAPDTYANVLDDLEGVYAKLDSFNGALGIIADWSADRAGLFYSFGNLVESIADDTEGLVHRMMALNRMAEPAEQAPAVVRFDPDFYRRTFDEWSAALIAATEAGDRVNDELHRKADHIADSIIKSSATTAGDAALKLRVISHILFVSNFQAERPQEAADLASLLADLERIDAAGGAGKAVRP